MAGAAAAGASARPTAEDSDSGESVEMTSAELVVRMEEKWQNEKLSADLQPPCTEEVDCLHEQVKVMERNIRTLPPDNDLLLPVHEMELKRIRYVLTSYLRTRLMKIQQNCWYYKKQEDDRRKLLQQNARPRPSPSKLMPNEYKFLLEYLNIVDGHLNNVGLQNMPLPCQNFDKSKLSQEPNLDSFIFFHCNRDRHVNVQEENIDVRLDTGSQYLMRYRPVAKLLENEDINLL